MTEDRKDGGGVFNILHIFLFMPQRNEEKLFIKHT